MRKLQWKKLLIAMTSGSFMLQTAGCANAALGATTLFTGITAGGVIYLVFRVLRD